MYGYKWALGDPTSANVSHTTLILWASFPNGTFYREIVHDPFEYEEFGGGDDDDDKGFKYSIGRNSLIWNPTRGVWITSINAAGFIIESVTQR
jgi:hypothetical protein